MTEISHSGYENMIKIHDLRKLAELNFCDECFHKYKSLIEPNVKECLFNPLGDWKRVESYVTQMVMKFKGVFKGDSVFISLDDDDCEKFADEVDAKAFKKIKRWGFKQKIDFLHNKGIIPDATHKFLNKVRLIRNTIHDEYSVLSEKDLTLFSVANVFTFHIYMATMYPAAKITSEFVADVEKAAENWLLKMSM